MMATTKKFVLICVGIYALPDLLLSHEMRDYVSPQMLCVLRLLNLLIGELVFHLSSPEYPVDLEHKELEFIHNFKGRFNHQNFVQD